MARMGKYFEGAFPIPAMMEKDFHRDIWPWYKIMERQIAEDLIIDEYVKKNEPVPGGIAMERRIDKKLDEWKRDID